MSDTLADDVLYLTALLAEDQSMVVPRLSGVIPDCGAWIRSRSYVEPGTARFVFEFPRDICVEIYSALVSVGLQLTAASHQPADRALPLHSARLRSVVEEASGSGWSDPGCRHAVHLFARNHQGAIADLDGQGRRIANPAWRQPMLRRLISKHFHSYSAQEGSSMCVFSRGKAAPAVVAYHRPEVKMHHPASTSP